MADHIVKYQARFGTIATPTLDIASTDDVRRVLHCYPSAMRSGTRVSKVLEKAYADNPADSPNWKYQIVIDVNFKELYVDHVADWVIYVQKTLGAPGERHELYTTNDINADTVEWNWKYPNCRLESVRSRATHTGRTRVTLMLTAGGEPVEDPT